MKKKIKIRIKKKDNKKIVPAELNSIEKRKLELKKTRRAQRIKRKLIIFSAFAIALGVTVIIFKAPFFNIKEVVCVGQERLSEEEILKYAKVVKGENVFITSLKDVKTRLSKIPYVKESNARRIFPDKIKLWVRECQPAFVIKNEDKFIVCDTETKVLEIVPENAENLCEITFPKSFSQEAGKPLIPDDSAENIKFIEIIKTMGDLNLINYTTTIDFTDISDIIILYDGRLKIKLGNTTDVSYKLKFIKEVIDKNISSHERATIDYTGDTLFVGQFEEDKPQTEEAEGDETENKDGEKEETAENAEKTENKEEETPQG